MADWTFAPEIDASAEWGPPPTLQTTLSDGKVISRQKHANAPETWEEEFKLSGSEFDTAKAFYESKGLITSFTKLSYDLFGTPTTERTVRFASPFAWTRAGEDYFIVRLTFTRHY